MKRQEPQVPLKIHHFSKDEPLEVLQSTFQTYAQFQLFIEVLTGIPPSQQKIIKNSRAVQVTGQIPLYQVGFQPNDKIILLTQQGQSLVEFRKQQLRQQLEREKQRVTQQNNIRKMVVFDKEGKYQENSHCRLIRGMMTQKVLERVVGRLLNVDHWKEKEHEILSKKGRLQSLLRYMWKDESDLGKIMNPGASYLWNRIDGIVCKMIVGFPLDLHETNTAPPESTADQKILKELSRMGYHQEKARQALERASNCYNEALTILCTRKDKKKFKLGVVDCSDELFIYQWLHRKCRRSVMMRMGVEGKEGERELELLLNSLRHRCYRLYEMMVGKREWVKYLARRESLKLVMRARTEFLDTSSSSSSDEQ